MNSLELLEKVLLQLETKPSLIVIMPVIIPHKTCVRSPSHPVWLDIFAQNWSFKSSRQLNVIYKKQNNIEFKLQNIFTIKHPHV